MLTLRSRLKTLRRSRDRGASAVEYALLITAIIGAIAVAVFALGTEVNEIFGDILTAIND